MQKEDRIIIFIPKSRLVVGGSRCEVVRDLVPRSLLRGSTRQKADGDEAPRGLCH